MKVKSRKFLVLALASALALGGCGGGSSSSGTSGNEQLVPTLSGVVADGYLRNAEVFADCNNNRIWDQGEAKTESGPGGAYTLTGAGIEECVVVVNVIAGQTVDEDAPDNPVARSYSLIAPAGRAEFISPLSTLVQGHVEGGKTLAEAEALVAVALGLDDSAILYQDYIEDDNADLHEVARGVATAFAAYKEAASNLGMSPKEVMEKVVGLTSQKLGEIKDKTFTPPTVEDVVAAVGFTQSMVSGKTFIVGDEVGEAGFVLILTFRADGTFEEWSNDNQPHTLHKLEGRWEIENGKLALNDAFGPTSIALTANASAYFDVMVQGDVDQPETARLFKTAPFTAELLAGKTFNFMGNGPGTVTFNPNGTGTMSDGTDPVENFNWSILDGVGLFGSSKYFLYAGGTASNFKMAGYDVLDQYIGTMEFVLSP